MNVIQMPKTRLDRSPPESERMILWWPIALTYPLFVWQFTQADVAPISACRLEQGLGPVYGGAEKLQSDPHWRDHILFYEYFHRDNGAGLDASLQTGCVAKLIQLFGLLDAKLTLEESKRAESKKGSA